MLCVSESITVVDMFEPVASAVSPFGELTARFGERLAITREENVASWSLEGRTATVFAHRDGSLEAMFSDRAMLDATRSASVTAIYRPLRAYALGPIGCSQMVDDMVAFFNGIREPRFSFSRLDPAPSVRA